MQEKAKTILEGRFKEANHLGNLDCIGGEKIRAPDLNTKRGPIAGNEGFFIKGLDPTCGDPRARPDPVGESEPKPRGRSVEVINQIPFVSVLLNLVSKVSRPETPT